jgi:hypothetical protein
MRLFKTVVRCSSVTLALVAALLLSGTSRAQAPHVYHPGDVIAIFVMFDGPDAGRITGAAADLQATINPPDQPNFSTDLYSSESGPSSPKTFEITLKIPTNQASGVYKLVLLRGVVTTPSIVLEYRPPTDFGELTFTIDNPDHFTKPTIKDVH